MSRKLIAIVAVCPAVVLCAFGASAQGPPAGRPPQRERPAGEPLRVQEVSPELERILRQWELNSSKIQKLQGIHRRFVYDKVFEVEKRADGIFYYEAPDKGRIDIAPAKIPPGEVSRRLNAQGQPYKIDGDRPERWICTGQEVKMINDTDKTVEVFTIPEHARGQNIMDGPLPFLFGMPAEKAKLRFELELLRETDTQVWIVAKPRWAEDAANYREAKIILDKPAFLPSAVQLIDPGGNLETVYTFAELKVNEKPGLLDRLWGSDPFNPKLPGYKTVQKAPAAPAPGQAPPGLAHPGQPNPAARAADGAPVPRQPGPAAQPGPGRQPVAAPPNGITVPSLVGLQWKEAQAIAEQLGLKVQFKRGETASREELIFVVYEQDPPHRTVASEGQAVTLTLFTKPEPRTGERE